MTALISKELLGRVDGLSATIAGDGSQRPFWCFGKPDAIDVSHSENFCWGEGGHNFTHAQQYKLCKDSLAAQLAEYNKVREEM